jgi:hypothetical protein
MVPDESAASTKAVRAIWSPDVVDIATEHPGHYEPPKAGAPPGPPPPFRSSLDARDRHEIVHLSSHFGMRKFGPKEPTGTPGPASLYVPEAFSVDYLMLTAFGATMRVLGEWEPPAICLNAACANPNTDTRVFTVEEWRHRASIGRDDMVQVLYKGYLMPFGIRASLVKVTERKFEPVDGVAVAPLRQRMFVLVRRSEKQYPAPGQRYGARDLPFRQVEILTRATPNISLPQKRRSSRRAQRWVFTLRIMLRYSDPRWMASRSSSCLAASTRMARRARVRCRCSSSTPRWRCGIPRQWCGTTRASPIRL